jgi:hypothetical protein
MSRYVGAAETGPILDGRRVRVADVSVQRVSDASNAGSRYEYRWRCTFLLLADDLTRCVMEDGIFAWAAAMASIGVVMWRHGVWKGDEECMSAVLDDALDEWVIMMTPCCDVLWWRSGGRSHSRGVKVSSHSQAAIETLLASVAQQLQGDHDEYQDTPWEPQQCLLPMLPISGMIINTSLNDLRVQPIKCDLRCVRGKKVHSQCDKQGNGRLTSRVEPRTQKRIECTCFLSDAPDWVNLFVDQTAMPTRPQGKGGIFLAYLWLSRMGNPSWTFVAN